MLATLKILGATYLAILIAEKLVSAYFTAAMMGIV